MKRFLALFLLLVCLPGCQSQNIPPNEPTAPSQAVATTVEIPQFTAPEPTEPKESLPAEPIVKEEPAIPSEWVVNGYVSVPMRSYPDGMVTENIPKDGIVELLGWTERYAKIKYNGNEGYVLAGYIMPADESYFALCLNTVKPTYLYTYWDMVADVNTLKKQYPTMVSTTSLGTSELGKDIPVLRIGKLDARYHVLLQGAVHGREHLTAWLLMAMADYWLAHGILNYGDVCYHIVPMVNPDGVTISQTQAINDKLYLIYLSDKNNGYTVKSVSGYAVDWKANGKGVDINRNFPSGWEQIDDRDGPSSERYKGVKPFSALEAAALRDYTLANSFDVTVSYHSSGSIIYYEYGKKEPVNSQSKALGQAVNQVSGYRMANSVGVGGAGYKDWAMEELGIPSLTVEIGSGDSPLNPTESYSTFVRNVGVLPAIAGWLQGET